ncbi:MAG: histidinol-phosphatase HisJ family protein [Fusobacteriaceae bacterium]
MFISDYHIHSSFSADSKENLDDIIERAVEIGLQEIAITDHYDLDSPQEQEGFILDIPRYFKKLQEAKESYKDKIDIKVGIEIGSQPQIYDDLNLLVDSYDWDFVLSSLHTVDRTDVAFPQFFAEKTREEAHNRYFEAVLDSVERFKNYSVMSHLDFITRYGGKEYRHMDLAKHWDIIDEILKKIISSNRGIEINTSGFRYGEDRTYPSDEILKRYFQLGGEIVTVGSDAHKKEDICRDFDRVYDFLESIGVKYISSFKNREVSFKKFR